MYESTLWQFCSYHIYIYYVTYDLLSILLRQYLHSNHKRNVHCKMSSSFSTFDGVCGQTPYAPNELHFIPLKSCSKDLTDYLTNLGVNGSRGFGTRLTEADVILNRAGLHSLSEEDRERITVCPKHRYELTTHYHLRSLWNRNRGTCWSKGLLREATRRSVTSL